LYFTIPLIPVTEILIVRVGVTVFGLWLLFNILFNWFMCYRTSPGHPPKLENYSSHLGQDSDDEENGRSPVPSNNLSEFVATSLAQKDEILLGLKNGSHQRKGGVSSGSGEANKAGTLPICHKCQALKPPRSHHCHVCKRCILGMDHHCPWVANCVGYFNYRYFYLFLVYMTLGCLFCILVSCWYYPVLSSVIANFSPNYYPQRWPTAPRAVTFIFLVCASAGFAVVILFMWHTYLISTGQSTIEFYQNRNKRSSAKRYRGQTYINEYDLGPTRNWENIFGRRTYFLAWMMPSKRLPPGDGIEWPTFRTLLLPIDLKAAHINMV
jgi:hypothetical protein